MKSKNKTTGKYNNSSNAIFAPQLELGAYIDGQLVASGFVTESEALNWIKNHTSYNIEEVRVGLKSTDPNFSPSRINAIGKSSLLCFQELAKPDYDRDIIIMYDDESKKYRAYMGVSALDAQDENADMAGHLALKEAKIKDIQFRFVLFHEDNGYYLNFYNYEGKAIPLTKQMTYDQN